MATVKTVLCRYFKQGSCKHGSKCKFAHGLEQLRITDATPIRYCYKYHLSFVLPIDPCNEEECTFSHSELTSDAWEGLFPGHAYPGNGYTLIGTILPLDACVTRDAPEEFIMEKAMRDYWLSIIKEHASSDLLQDLAEQILRAH